MKPSTLAGCAITAVSGLSVTANVATAVALRSPAASVACAGITATSLVVIYKMTLDRLEALYEMTLTFGAVTGRYVHIRDVISFDRVAEPGVDHWQNQIPLPFPDRGSRETVSAA